MIDMMRGSHTGQGNETPYDIVLGIVILGVVVVRAKAGGFVGQVSARADRTEKNGRVRAILDEQYARGELTTKEYQQPLKRLKENR